MGKQSQSAEALWRDRLARFRQSDITVTQFCRQEGVSVPSFYHWRKRLGDQQKTPVVRRSGDRRPKTTASQQFVPVSVPAVTFAEIEFPNGVRIRVPASNADALREAIRAANEIFREVG